MERLGQARNGKLPTVAEWTDPRVRRFEPSATVQTLHLSWIRSANIRPMDGVPQVLEAIDVAEILCTVVMKDDGRRVRVSGSREAPIDFSSDLFTKGGVVVLRSLKSLVILF